MYLCLIYSPSGLDATVLPRSIRGPQEPLNSYWMEINLSNPNNEGKTQSNQYLMNKANASSHSYYLEVSDTTNFKAQTEVNVHSGQIEYLHLGILPLRTRR